MNHVKKYWAGVPAVVRKPVILLIGIAIIIAGLVMLVFPGPGWVAIFLGFAVLATEFTFAVIVRDWLIKQLKRVVDWAAAQRDKLLKSKK